MIIIVNTNINLIELRKMPEDTTRYMPEDTTYNTELRKMSEDTTKDIGSIIKMPKDPTKEKYQIKAPTLDEIMQKEGFKRVAKLEVQADGSIHLPVDLVSDTKGGSIFGQSSYVELRIIDETEINLYLIGKRNSFIVYQRDTRR